MNAALLLAIASITAAATAHSSLAQTTPADPTTASTHQAAVAPIDPATGVVPSSGNTTTDKSLIKTSTTGGPTGMGTGLDISSGATPTPTPTIPTPSSTEKEGSSK